MKNTIKKGLGITAVFTLLLCLCMLFSACGEGKAAAVINNSVTPVVANGSGATIASGTESGSGLTWTIYEDGMMRLSGMPTDTDGSMYDYAFYNQTPAWASYSDKITALEISNDVKIITQGAFSNLKSLIWIQFGNGVETISADAFKGCTNLRRVVLPTSVKTIGNSAFSGCYRLREAVLNEGLTALGAQAFGGCYSLITVTLPSTLTGSAISNTAFAECPHIVEVITARNLTAGATSDGGVAKNATTVHTGETQLVTDASGFITMGNRLLGYAGTATEIVIPAGVEVIDKYAFYANTSLTTVTIGDSVITISDSAFEGCEGITTLTIGTKLTSVGAKVFANCSGITTLKYNATNCRICPENLFSSATKLKNVEFGATVQTLPKGMFNGCATLTTVDLPANLTQIQANLFADCSSLTSVKMGSKVTSIGDSAFKNCIRLQSIDLSNVKLTQIGVEAFFGCRSLTMLELTSVQIIGNSAFSACGALMCVVVGPATTEIGDDAFLSCYKLVDVVDNGSPLTFRAGREGNGRIANYTEFATGTGSASRLVPVGDFLFFETEKVNYLIGYTGTDSTATLPANYKGANYEIYTKAFSGNGNIKNVTLGAGVTAIGAGAFENCSALTRFDTGSAALASIGANAFYNCKALTSVTLNTGLATIGERAFEQCAALTEVTVPNSVVQLGNGAFRRSGITTATLGTGVTELPEYLFEGCKALKTINFGAGTIAIGYGTFSNCTALEAVTLPATLTTISRDAFNGCSALFALVLPNTVNMVGIEAFANCSALVSVTLGTGITGLSNRAFANCERLVEVINNSALELPIGTDGPGMITRRAELVLTNGESTTVGTDGDYRYIIIDSLTYLLSYTGNETTLTLPQTLNGAPYRIMKYAFYGSNVKDVTIGNGCREIGGYAFAHSAIETVSVTGMVPSIGAFAFAETPIRKVTLNNGQFSTIGTGAFQNCKELRSIDMPASLRTISMGAFSGCEKLTSVNLNSGLQTISGFAFKGCYTLKQITIPSSVTSLGNKWAADCYSLVQIKNLSNVTIRIDGFGMNGNVKVVLRVDHQNYIKTDENGFVFYSYNSNATLIGYTGTATDLVLPELYENASYTINKYAFYGLDGITSIRVSSGVTGIGEYAFAGCTGLKAVYLPSTVTAGVGDYVVKNCANTMILVTGCTGADTVPESWGAEWATQSDNFAYTVTYGYSAERFAALIGD